MKWLAVILKISAYTLGHLMAKRGRPKKIKDEFIFDCPLQASAFRRCLARIKTRALIEKTDEAVVLHLRPVNFVDLYTAMNNHGLEKADRLRKMCRAVENDFSDKGYFRFTHFQQ